jgi:hypothetical protein
MQGLSINKFRVKWFGIALLGFILCGLIGYTAYQISQYSIVYSYIIIFGLLGVLVTGLLLTLQVHRKKLENSIKEAAIELQATHGINKLTETPLNLGDWAITAHFLDRLVREIYLRKPKLILECGSGTSTLVSSSCLKELAK